MLLKNCVLKLISFFNVFKPREEINERKLIEIPVLTEIYGGPKVTAHRSFGQQAGIPGLGNATASSVNI